MKVNVRHSKISCFVENMIINKEISSLYIAILKYNIKYSVIPSYGQSVFLGTVHENNWGMDEPYIIKLLPNIW